MLPVLAGLLSIADRLSQASSVEDVAATVVSGGAEAVGAYAAAVFVLNPTRETLELVDARGYPDAVVEQIRLIPLESNNPLAIAVRDAGALVMDRERLVSDAEVGELAARTSSQEARVLPLVIDGRRIGANAFGWRLASGFGEDEAACLDAVAKLAAQAIERVRLVAAERAARVRVTELYDLAVSLGDAQTPEEVCDRVLTAALRTVHASAGAVFLVTDDDAALELYRSEGYDMKAITSFAHIPADVPLPITTAWRTGELQAFPTERAFAAAYPSSPAGSSRGIARIAAPIVSRGRVLGTLALSAAQRPAFAEVELQHILAIANQCGQSLDRALAFARERAARTAAEQASRLRDDLIAVVSHDLRNPLASLVSASELLAMTMSSDSLKKGERYLNTIQKAGVRMRTLLDDLLDITRIESGRLEIERKTEDVGAVVRESLELHEPLATSKSIRLELDVIGRAVASCDRHRIQQVVGNLLGNAIKFTTEGGRIRVEVMRRTDDICVSVLDTGPGISPEQLPHLFDRYWQARRGTRQGLGLGLSIVKGIVEAHGGRVSVDSEPGTGSTFRFTMPALLASVPAIGQA